MVESTTESDNEGSVPDSGGRKGLAVAGVQKKQEREV